MNPKRQELTQQNHKTNLEKRSPKKTNNTTLTKRISLIIYKVKRVISKPELHQKNVIKYIYIFLKEIWA